MPTPTTYNTQYELYNVDFKRGDVRHFTSEAQRSEYFDESHLIDSGTLNSYIRVDQDFKIDKTYADIREANYCRYNNGDGDGWRYAYITRMEVVSTSCTRLYIQQDPWQNNMFNFEIHGTRLRGHVDRLASKSGLYYPRVYSFTPETVTTSTQATITDANAPDIVFLWYVTSEKIGTSIDSFTSFFSQGLYYYVFPVYRYFEDMTINVTGEDPFEITPDTIFYFENSAYIVNKFFTCQLPDGMTASVNEARNVTTLDGSLYVCTEGTHKFVQYIPQSEVGASDRTMPIDNINQVTGNLSPSNRRNINLETKLYEFPFAYQEVRFGNVKLRIFNELIDGTAAPQVSYNVFPSADGMTAVIKPPVNYGINSALAEVEAVTAAVSQSATVRRDVENTYLAANETKMWGQVIQGLVGAIANPKHLVENLGYTANASINQLATRIDLRNAPDQFTLNGDIVAVSQTVTQNISLVTFKPVEDDLNFLYSYFYTYGYTINEWQNIPYTQIRTRYYFDYYLFGDDVHCDVQDSATARELMEEDLRKGVTFWHWNETTNGFQHTRENLEMSLITN